MPRLEFPRKVRRAIFERAAGTIVTCTACGSGFDRGYRISAKRAAKPQYCSKACRTSRIAHTDAAAFASLKSRYLAMATRRDGDECWVWTGRKNNTGYGVIDYRRRPHLAHRISYWLHYGEQPGEMDVCHSCDNPECTNPAHLWLGTAEDNAKDAAAKGRLGNNGCRGAAIGTSKLTEEQARRAKYSDTPVASLAKEFGVTREAVAMIRRGVNWKWL